MIYGDGILLHPTYILLVQTMFESPAKRTLFREEAKVAKKKIKIAKVFLKILRLTL